MRALCLDLGANHGAFSTMMARQAKLVILVEMNPQFRENITHNMVINGFENYEIETVFVGRGGMCDDDNKSRATILDLLKKHHLETVDLVKMDIEGSEYDVFRSPEWLDRVNALCMEVHPACGDPQEILTALESHAFDFAVTDCEFRPVEDLKRADFIYAWKKRSETKHHSES
jgi:hypothetical protein